jgi:hypothetical protein
MDLYLQEINIKIECHNRTLSLIHDDDWVQTQYLETVNSTLVWNICYAL